MTATANPLPPHPDVQPSAIRLLHLDDALLLASKPAGLLAVPGRGAARQDCLVTRVQASHPEALIVHRLDQATSGLMLLARDPSTQRRLSGLFESRQIHKRYIAVVDGQLEDDEGQVDLPLVADWPNRPRQKVDRAQGRPSLTRWRVLARNRDENSTRVELEPATGRTHQLRVHMQALGHPILGDALYAGEQTRGKADRLLLHACTLAFAHPVSGEGLRFEDTVPF